MKKLMMGLATAAFVGFLSAPAEAGNIPLTILSSTCSAACSTVTIDGGPKGDSFVELFGDVRLSINAASNNPENTLLAFLTQTDIARNPLFADAETETVEVSQTDFVLPMGSANLGSALSGTAASIAGVGGASLTSEYRAGNSLSQYSIGAALGSCNFSGVVPRPACAQNASTALLAVAPYSLSNVFVISLAGGGYDALSVTGTTTVTAVPDGGATVALLGMAMTALGLMARRRA